MKKRVKCILSILIVFTVLISTVSISFAKDEILTGKMYDGEFTCELNRGEGVLTIEGLGMLLQGDVESALNLESDLPSVKTIVIKEGVYLINLSSQYYGYHDFSDVTTITIPSTMKRINWDSFSKAEKLETINYAGSKEDWENIVIDGGNDVLYNATFNFNTEVPATDGNENYECDMIKSIELSFGDVQLSQNYYTSVFTISGNGLVGADDCGHGSVPITNSFCDSTKDYYYSPAVQEVIIESGITEIGSGLLNGSHIKSITIPETVEKIYPCVVSGSSDIKDIYYEGTKTDWMNLDIGAENEELILAQKHFGTRTTAKELKVELEQKDFVFDGEVKFPKVVVTDENGKVLDNNIDYYIDAEHDYMNSCVMNANKTGKYKIVVKMCGEYTGKATKYFYIRAKAPEIDSVKSRDGGFTVVWNKYDPEENGTVNGYEVQYSNSPKFTKAKTIVMKYNTNYAKKVTGLETGTTYYVRVRTLTKVSDGYIRSAWSNVKSVKAG